MLSGYDADAGADSAAIRLRANALYLEPAIFRRGVVAKQRRCLVHVDHHNVHIAIVVEVAECRSSARARFIENGTAIRGDIGKVAIPQVAVENFPLFECEMQLLGVHFGEYVATRNEYVGPPVVVEIEQSHSPTEIFHIDSQTSLQDSIVESSISI